MRPPPLRSPLQSPPQPLFSLPLPAPTTHCTWCVARVGVRLRWDGTPPPPADASSTVHLQGWPERKRVGAFGHFAGEKRPSLCSLLPSPRWRASARTHGARTAACMAGGSRAGRQRPYLHLAGPVGMWGRIEHRGASAAVSTLRSTPTRQVREQVRRSVASSHAIISTSTCARGESKKDFAGFRNKC